MKFLVYSFIIAFLLFGAVSAETKGVKLYSNVKSAKIGDLLNITVEAQCDNPDENQNISLELSEDISFGDLEILNKKNPVIREENGIKTAVWQFEAMSFSLGEKEIGPAKVTLRISDTRETLTSNKIKINIESVLGEDDKEIKDIKNNLPVQFPWYYYAAVIAILLLIFVIFLLIIYFIFKYLSKRTSAAEILKTPEEIAEDKLKMLKSSSLLEEGKVRQYYQELSDILRIYLDGRYKIQAPDLTTSELYKILKGSDFSQETVQSMKALLGKCDMVKFAKFIPEDQFFSEDYNETKRIFESIKPPKEEP